MPLLVHQEPETEGLITTFETWYAAMSRGNLNDDLLFAVDAGIGINTLIEKALVHGVVIQQCGACHRPMYSKQATPVYMGSQYVCSRCKERYYVHCRKCGCPVLADDDDHLHGLDYHEAYKRLNKVIPWNDDIMAHRDGFFCTVSEKHRKDRRYFGIELELERDKAQVVPPDLIARSQYLFTVPDFTICQHDGSLTPAAPGMKNGTNGFELITLPATLDYHIHDAGWDKMLGKIGKYFEYSPNTAGLHVHVGTQGISKLTIGKIIVFVNYLANQAFMYSIAERAYNEPSPLNGKVYAEARVGGHGTPEDYRKWVADRVSEITMHRVHHPNCWQMKANREFIEYYRDTKGNTQTDKNGRPLIHTMTPRKFRRPIPCWCLPGKYINIHDDPEKKRRYEAINISTKRATFEFRIFRGMPSAEHVFASLEFCDALINFCALRKLTELSYRDFLAWMTGQRRNYPYLTKKLVDKHWLMRRRR